MISYTTLLAVAATLPSSCAIEIKLNQGHTLDEAKKLYPDAQTSPLFTLPRTRLIELSSVEKGLPDLTLWYSFDPSDASLTAQTEEHIVTSLKQLKSIDYVEIPKGAMPSRRLAVTPNFVPNQGYLKMNSPTNNGIDAEYSWTFDGGNGEGVTIYDVECSWNQQHEDVKVAHDVVLLLDKGDEASYDPEIYHGVAVLGEMVGTSNTFGITGISHGAKIGLAPADTKNLGRRPSNAIMLAVDDGKPGDIILVEMQREVCGYPYLPDRADGLGPMEEQQSVFEATQVATANGITVVAVAGNGNVDLDAPRCESKYDRNVRDSGAIIVGAGGSGVKCLGGWDGASREKLDYSTYGSRLDVHGWGECIWTTGYGDAYNDTDAQDDENKKYTDEFGGTSGATPFVAAAAANIQGIAMKNFGAPLKPAQLRQLLTDTGLPQLGDVSKKIGPLVNLRAAIDTLFENPPTKKPSEKPTNQPTAKPSAVSKAGKASEIARPSQYKSGKSDKGGKGGKSNRKK